LAKTILEVIGIAVVAGYTTYAALQWGTMNKTYGEIKAQTASAKQAAQAAADNAEMTFWALRENEETSAFTLQQMQAQSNAQERAAIAAKSAADTAASQLELVERPWVDATITLDGPLTFNVNGANIPLHFAIRNTGNSPAQSLVIHPVAVVDGMNAPNYRSEACRSATLISNSMPQFGITLFPKVDFQQGEIVTLGKEEFEKFWKTPFGSHFSGQIIMPAVVICMAYQPTFKKDTVYHTAYIVDLFKLDSAGMNIAFQVGEDIDQKHLLLRIHPSDAVWAE